MQEEELENELELLTIREDTRIPLNPQNKNIEKSSRSQIEIDASTASHTIVGSELTVSGTSTKSLGIRDTLAMYYERHLAIQRVSGENLSLEGCYVNLATVEAIHQRKNDQTQLKARSEFFNRMESYERVAGTKLESIIPLEDLFNKRLLRDGNESVPRKILIQGRAGIGKTTLCKKLVHLFINGRWNERFDAVIWIPLRQLKSYKSRTMEDLISEKYFAQHVDHEKIHLIDELFTGIKLDKVLFILDGLDEILYDAQRDVAMGSLLTELLSQTHLIVTSRPSSADHSILPNLDLELETVGFNSDNISDYVNNILEGESAKSVQDFIRQTPIAQSLANIPVQLDAICYSWESLPKDVDTVTITKLYQGMINKLWRKDSVRSEKPNNSIAQMNNTHAHQVNQFMAAEMEFLSYLAFKGIQHNIIEFDIESLNNTVSTHDGIDSQQSRLPQDILDKVKQTPFLHSTESDMQQSWHFIHLTFQEFFAAAWLARQFHGNQTDASKQLTTLTWEETSEFIQCNKYNPRYEIVWWMLAGQLEGKDLEMFFEILSSEPRDIAGVRHALLLSGCYTESLYNIEEPLITKLETEISQIIHLDITIRGKYFDGGILGAQQIIPEKILTSHCFSTEKELEYSIAAFQYRPTITLETVQHLINLPDGHKGKWRLRITRALETRSILPDSAIKYLDTSLRDRDPNIRITAIKALEIQPLLPTSVIQSLYGALKDDHSYVRSSATKALQSLSRQQPAILLHTQAQDYKESSSVEASSRQLALPSSNIQYSNPLRDNDPGIGSSAVNPLGNQSTLQQKSIQPLGLKDKDPRIRSLTAKAFGNQSELSPVVIQLLVEALKDRVDYVKSSAVIALGNQKTLPPSAIQGVIDTLRDGHWSVRSSAATALGQIFSSASIQLLLNALKDKDSFVRVTAVKALENLSSVPTSAIEPLINGLKDADKVVRLSSVRVLGSQSDLPPSAIQSLIDALNDEYSYIKSAAAKTLGSQSVYPQSAIPHLVNILRDSDMDVRISAVEALGKSPILPLSALQHLITTLKDPYWSVRSSAIKALSNQQTLPPLVIQSLVDSLGDRDEHVRLLAIKALRDQKPLPSLAIQPLIDLLMDQYQDWKVKSSAAEALGSQSTLSNIPANALVDILDYYQPKTHVVCQLIPTLSMDDIVKIFKIYLFPVACGLGLSLYISNNRLCFYTEHGFDQSEPLDQICITKIESAFETARSQDLIDN
ncbi:hypothetical protein BGZ76_000625 [Entomortierella beljakovae]|nr:hypothetical protein BGZ76_000625 [Entomortierella beljakovae]